MAKPPSRPRKTAAAVFATANSRLRPAAVTTNMSGAISGDDSQKAMTGGSGMPMASSAAISGITPHEQNGDSAPNSAAATTIAAARPRNARAMRRSAAAACR